MKTYQPGDQLGNGATVIHSTVIDNAREPIGLVLAKLPLEYTIHRYGGDDEYPVLFWGNYLSHFRTACETYFKRIDAAQS